MRKREDTINTFLGCKTINSYAEVEIISGPCIMYIVALKQFNLDINLLRF